MHRVATEKLILLKTNKKIMKKILLSFTLMLMSPLWSFAQKLPKIMPPAPNASSLLKFNDVPISLSTGVPKINIPIFEVKENNVSIHIGLNYHAGGIRVEEVSSWVGLGWNLNAGGGITRVTRGLPDDSSNGYMYTGDKVLEMRKLLTVSSGTNPIIAGSLYTKINEANMGGNDFEPDIFNYNFNGYSGRFMYNQQTRKFVQTPMSDIIISTEKDTSNKITAWIFTTPDGVKYYFGQSKNKKRSAYDINIKGTPVIYSNNNVSISQGSSVPNHISTWHLMEVVTPSNKSINFSYQSSLPIQLTSKSGERFLNKGCGASAYEAYFTISKYTETYLKEISFSNGRIDFIRDANDRLDLKNSKALNQIKIFDKSNKLIKKILFNYDYFVCSNKDIYPWGSFLGDKDQREKRLKLLSIQEFGKNNTQIPPYTFEYNTTKLPNRFSKAQDYWGYYNGEHSNRDLIPKIKINSLYYGTSKRNVNREYAKAGVLKKINYPTGGYANYYYESNVVPNSGMRELYDTKNVIERFDNSTIQKYNTFSIKKDGRRRVPVNIDTYVSGCDNFNLGNFSCDFSIKIVNVSNPKYSFVVFRNNLEVKMVPGDYKIEVTPMGNGNTVNPKFSIALSWEELIESKNFLAGGLRVSKTEINDRKSSVFKNYDYTQFGNDKSSGFMVSKPFFTDTEFLNSTCPGKPLVLKISSNDLYTTQKTNGSYVGYSNVTEYIVGSGKTEYTFSSIGSYYDGGFAHGGVILPDLYVNWLRGNLLKRTLFKELNNTYIPVYSEQNEYERTGTLKTNNTGITTVHTIGGFKIGFYSSLTEKYRIKKQRFTNFFDSTVLETVKKYYYDNSNYLQPTRVETTNSKGEVLKTRMYYADDKLKLSNLNSDVFSSAIDKLKLQNRISEPIQMDSYKGNVLLSRQRTNYKDWGNNIVLPENVQTLKGIPSSTNKLEDRVVYHNYDDKGNPTELSKKDGTHVVYIWGYYQTQPVAKIEGTKLSDIPTNYISNIQNASNIDNDRTMNYDGREGNLRKQLNKLHQLTALKKSLMTFYTYDPLIGITSITDSRGETIYYEYDDFNRLQCVKDSQGNILKEHKYNYKR